MIDIHCHLLPGVDDGARCWDDAVEMARMAYADGIRTIIATPHQMGSYAHVRGELIRTRCVQLQQLLQQRGIETDLLPGANVRLEANMLERLVRGDLLTLADQRRHLLVDVPSDAFFKLDDLVDQLARGGIVMVLAKPERNTVLAKMPRRVTALVERGCLMQITAGSLLGDFGGTALKMAEWMLAEQLVHFVASDAHGPRARRPLLRLARQRVEHLADADTARRLFEEHPAAILRGAPIEAVRRVSRAKIFFGRVPWRRAA